MRSFLAIMAIFVSSYLNLATAQQLPECKDGQHVRFEGTIQTVDTLVDEFMWSFKIAPTHADCAASEIVVTGRPEATCVVGAVMEGQGDFGEGNVAASNEDIYCD
ncbi:MAG: hypothetical protein AB7J30_01190 [Hyphomicrobium sp.]|uniref:hypothetical protein n=1 Tax=Hyphomicrobium sp. TaxID=82 RepID=UPI003D138EE9